jgi:hypothetical protein
MNDICRDWQLVESERPKPVVEEVEATPVVNPDTNKRMSKIELRLMGLNRIKEKEQEIQRKSVIARKKEEQKKLKELEAQFMNAEMSSSSSEEEEDPRSFGEYFMFRRKKEIKMMQQQFSNLL